MPDHQAHRRKQLARHPGQADRILRPSLKRAELLLRSQEHKPVSPVMARHVAHEGQRLTAAVSSLRGFRNALGRKAGWLLGNMMRYMATTAHHHPHVMKCRGDICPWEGWREDFAALREAHPEWAESIALEVDYFARVEAADAYEAKRAAFWRAMADEGQALLDEMLSVDHPRADELRERVEECERQWRSFADVPSPPTLADMPVMGRA
jgi:hypothetical protein